MNMESVLKEMEMYNVSPLTIDDEIEFLENEISRFIEMAGAENEAP